MMTTAESCVLHAASMVFLTVPALDIHMHPKGEAGSYPPCTHRLTALSLDHTWLTALPPNHTLYLTESLLFRFGKAEKSGRGSA